MWMTGSSLKGESLLLPTGTYVVKAYSADKDVHAVGFEGKAYLCRSDRRKSGKGC